MSGIFTYEKLVAKAGYGKYRPNEFSECQILMHFQQPEQQPASDAVSSIGYQLDEEIKIVIGHGMTHVACTVDLCLLTMYEGEECVLKTKCSALGDEFITLNITLLSFLAASELCNTSYNDKLQHAVTLKELGTSAYAAGNVSAAFHKFSRSLKYLTCATADKSVSSGVNNDVLPNGTCTSDSRHTVLDNCAASYPSVCNLTREDVDKLKCRSLLNLSACQLRYNNYKLAVVNCSKALDIDPNNVKGLYRRAQCNMQTGNEHAAVEDLERALALEPGNREITRLLSKARQLTHKTDEKLAAAMSKMFQ